MNKTAKHLLISLPTSFGLPFVAAAMLWLGSWLDAGFSYGWIASVVMFFAAPIFFGWLLGKKAPLADSFGLRWAPVLLPVAVALMLFPLASLLFETPLLNIASAVLGIGLAALYLVFWLSLAIFMRKRPDSRNRKGGLLAIALLFVVALAAAGICTWMIYEHIFTGKPDDVSVGHGVNTGEYMPFYKGNQLAVPDFEPSLRIAANFPRLDGAIAVLPIYGAAAQAVYAREGAEGTVYCTNTPSAYRRLIDGEADIFFGLGPSERQLEYARIQGVELTITPIAREAFVFFVNSENPVRGLSLEQIRAIYTRKVTNWRELRHIGANAGEANAGLPSGLPDAKILAFQRPEGSGSQTAMLKLVMADREIMRPLREESMTGMGDIVLTTAAYRNRLNAIGYSFRWYATVQFANSGIRLLAVDGVEPDVQSIRNGSYPLIADLVAVTARPLSPESRALLDWLRGPEGQRLIEKVGYVPLAGQSPESSQP